MRYNYRTYCSKENLKKIRSFVADTLTHTDFSEIEINQMVLAVDEICANLVIHSQQCNGQQSIELNIHIEPESLLFEIIDFDSHSSFNFQSYERPDLQVLKATGRKGGMGLMLVSSIMDHIEVLQKDKNRVWHLEKKMKPS
jgi:serine/threonine-protein kinase RsbW